MQVRREKRDGAVRILSSGYAGQTARGLGGNYERYLGCPLGRIVTEYPSLVTQTFDVKLGVLHGIVTCIGTAVRVN